MHEDRISPYLARLQELPFVEDVRVEQISYDPSADAILLVRTPTGPRRLVAELKSSNLTGAHVVEVLGRHQHSDSVQSILFAPYIGGGPAQRLEDAGMNFLDLAGNCHVRFGSEYVASIRGKRRPRPKRGRGLGLAGYRAIFAVLARPELLDAPVRTIAEVAGVSKSAVAESFARHAEENLIIEIDGKRRVLSKQRLLDQWLTGYATIVRPRLVAGTYRTPDDGVTALQERVEALWNRRRDWAWGGAAAARRLLRFYESDHAVLHTASWNPDFARELKVVRDRDGWLTVLTSATPLELEGMEPRTAHPLLVYTELLASDSPRAHETAQLLRERYLDL